MKQEKNKWIRALWIIIGITALSFFVSIIISLFLGNDFEALDGNVAVIKIHGTIVSDEDHFSFEEVASSDEIIKLIKKADKNPSIKAIILEINSPGGSAVASEEIANEVKKVNKTTVAWIREIGASGAYWVASSAEHVVANRMSLTGSIGVIASYLGFSGFLAEHNVTYERLVSGNLKDIGSPFKDMTKEEKALFEKSLESMHNYFIEEVAKNRNLKKSDIKKIATGLFYLGDEAKELGLIDELGSKDEAIAYIEQQIKEKAHLAEYKEEKGLLHKLSQVFSKQSFYIGRGIGSSIFAQSKTARGISIFT
ncbi:signal peptide peptidase SppA [Candidatus Woesearchaeota archaeon]|nr:signal peptide peptidase SppA [Candidatus Woesearchaeota archaeon]